MWLYGIALLFQLTSLGADELKVAELVGVQPGILSKKATGLTVKMVSMLYIVIETDIT